MGCSAAFALYMHQRRPATIGCDLVPSCSCTTNVLVAHPEMLGAGRAAVVVVARTRRATGIEVGCAVRARAGVGGGRTGGRGGAKRQVERRRPCWVEKGFSRCGCVRYVPWRFIRYSATLTLHFLPTLERTSRRHRSTAGHHVSQRMRYSRQ